MVGIHGIYSLSFLELWSLSQGGYSLQILKFVNQSKVSDISSLKSLGEIGASKKNDRINGLLKMRLIRKANNELELTALGYCIAFFTHIIAKTVNLQERG